MVRSVSRWSVESKDFDLSVVGGFTGIRIREKCKGVTRSIFLRRDEAVWLIKSFDELVSAQDSRVFWNQSVAGFPRILGQQCSNRHGFFLLIEEYEGRKKNGSILVPKGRYGEGWERFEVELRLAISHLQADQSRVTKQTSAPKVLLAGTKAETRRSFAEVLTSARPGNEEPFGPSSQPLARIPRWLEGSKVTGKKELYQVQDPVKDFRAHAKAPVCPATSSSMFPPTAAHDSRSREFFPAKGLKKKPAPVSRASGKSQDSFPRREAVGSANTSSADSRNVFSGDRLGVRRLRESLAALHEEIGLCLTDLLLLEEGHLDFSQKQFASHAAPKTKQAFMGFKDTRPISKSSKVAHDSKGKAPLGFPIKKPKVIVKAKTGSCLRPIPTPVFSMHVGASTSAAHQVRKAKDSGASARGSGSDHSSRGFQRVYQRRKSGISKAVWTRKQGQVTVGGRSVRAEKPENSLRLSLPEVVLCGEEGEDAAVALQVDGGSLKGNISTEVGEQVSGVLPELLVTECSCNELGAPAVGTSSVTKMMDINNLQLVICEPVLVGNQGESCLGEDAGVTDEGDILLDSGTQDVRSDLLLELEEKNSNEGASGAPLEITPLAAKGGEKHRISPRWVVEKVMRCYQAIGLSCEGFEDRMLAMFEEIEAAGGRSSASPQTLCPLNKGAKGKRELNRLAWSLNYEKKGALSARGRIKGRGSVCNYDA
jgi:hypothetical protein